MSFNIPRIPLHLQNSPLFKSTEYANPSYESFRDNEIHPVNYKEMSDRPSVHPMANIKRFPNGELDYEAAVNTIMTALHTAERGMYLTPVEESFLTVLFPGKFTEQEPQMAEIQTQLSATEKNALRELLEATIKEEFNYNAGRGGGSIGGRTRTIL